jgi:lipopolysaccharide/colanic/teichoic acid biosynthesis glycosyltransferase
MIAKRAFDILLSGITLVVVTPLLIFLAILIKLDSPGPVFFTQTRVGRHGKLFCIHKLRSMTVGAESIGPFITVDRDKRVTRFGSFLRRTKLDELPQMLDVFVGNMSFVGPRPEVPKYVALYPDRVKTTILSLRPGITDYAALAYGREGELLIRSVDPEETYVKQILPAKVNYYYDYAVNRNFVTDLRIILATLLVVLGIKRWNDPGPEADYRRHGSTTRADSLPSNPDKSPLLLRSRDVFPPGTSSRSSN